MNTPIQSIISKTNSMTEIDTLGRRMINYKQLLFILAEGIKDEQIHLIDMCRIGSENQGINGADVYKTKYDNKEIPGI